MNEDMSTEAEVIMPQGRYIVELRDVDTGKVQEIVKSNYITRAKRC